jgi:hypothetical protein
MSEIFDFLKTPMGQGLLGAAFTGLATANRGTPINNLGKAGMGGLLGYTNAVNQQDKMAEQAMQNKVRQMQLAEMERKQNAWNSLKGSVPPEMMPFVELAPEAAAKSMFKEQEKPQLVTVQTPQGPMQRWVRPGESTGFDVGPPVDKESALPWYVRKGQDGQMSIDPAYADLEKTKASFGRPPAQPMAPVAYVDPATGQTVWGTITEARGKPAANYSPAVQGAVAGAKVTGEALAKKDINMSGLDTVLGEARSLLEGRATGARPTGSAVGTAVDAAGALVGIDPSGAKEASRLKAISGALTAKMPRMEGPQSDKDVQLYKEMAADVGNSMLPVGRRLAALKTVEALNSKYAKPSNADDPLGIRSGR